MKKKNKQRAFGILILMTILLAASTLSGCGSKSAEKSTVSSAKDLAGAKIGVQLGTTGDLYVSDYERSVPRRNHKPDLR